LYQVGIIYLSVKIIHRHLEILTIYGNKKGAPINAFDILFLSYYPFLLINLGEILKGYRKHFKITFSCAFIEGLAFGIDKLVDWMS
jgi:hypothetical protein